MYAAGGNETDVEQKKEDLIWLRQNFARYGYDRPIFVPFTLLKFGVTKYVFNYSY